MSKSERIKTAFKFIRKEYGKDATFIWRGKKYKAKQKNEK